MNELTIFLLRSGIQENTLYILLAIPLAATIILFARDIIGIQSFNLYTTVIAVLAFASTGIFLGLIITILILIFDYIVKYFIKDLKLHYASKVAIVISIVALSMILSLYIAHTFLGLNTHISAYSMLILILLADSLSFTKINKGENKGSIIYAQTVILAVVTFIIIDNSFTHMLLLKYPYISILAILLDIYIGRTSSLRLREFYRFRNISKE